MNNYISADLPRNRLLFPDEVTFSGRSNESDQVLQELREVYAHFYEPISRMGIANRFFFLETLWKEEIQLCSSMNQIIMNKNYQQIIGMGPFALPFIFFSLHREPDYWFHALFSITGINPIPESAKGNLQKMTEVWLEWGRVNGFLN